MAETNSDIIQAATRDALQKTETLQNALAALANDPQTPGALSGSRQDLASAHAAFLQAEVAVFYSDGDAPLELMALPDPDNSTQTSTQPHGYRAIGKLMETYAAQGIEPGNSEMAKSPGQIVILALVGQTQDMVTNLQQFGDAWDRDDSSDFRNQFFLSSPEDSVRRIIQGYTTMIGSVLPLRAAEGQPDVLISLCALRSLYLGCYQSRDGTLISGPGIRTIIEETAPQTAREIDDGFLNAMALARVATYQAAGNRSETPNSQLISSLKSLEAEWAAAAASLSFEVLKSEDIGQQ